METRMFHRRRSWTFLWWGNEYLRLDKTRIDKSTVANAKIVAANAHALHPPFQ
jgi:hypothetical protein